jgi:hypothetical protein
MSYTFDQLKEDVRKEAEALKIHATNEERERLDFEILDPNNMHNCIYGQMTGYCFSTRSAILINECCVRYFKHDIMPGFYEESTDFDRIKRGVNGATVNGFIGERTEPFSSCHFSAIEAYILLPEAKNANLIAFLRGETDNLEL